MVRRGVPVGAVAVESTRAMNLVVWVADALRVDHVGCYGAEQVSTPTIDGLAAGGVRFDQAISAAPWTAPSTASMITGLYPHHHGYLHWDAELDPAYPTLFTVAAAHGYETGTFVFDERYLFRDFADANVAGTSERLDGAVEWLRERAAKPFCLWFHSWTTHMPYGVLHSERKEWKRAKEEIISGIQSGDPAALDALRESYREAVRAGVRAALCRLPPGARGARPARADGYRVRLRPRRVVGRALRRQDAGQGHVPHARRRPLRRDRPRAADPLCARTRGAGDRPLAGEPRRPDADAARAGGRADRRARRDVAAATCRGRRAGRPAGLHRRHRQGRRVAARACGSHPGS